jgi:Tol biopolymer transport system component
MNNGGIETRSFLSPDGMKILFSSSGNRKSDYNDEIYVMNANGSNPVRLTHDPGEDLEPDWQTLP